MKELETNHGTIVISEFESKYELYERFDISGFVSSNTSNSSQYELVKDKIKIDKNNNIFFIKILLYYNTWIIKQKSRNKICFFISALHFFILLVY